MHSLARLSFETNEEDVIALHLYGLHKSPLVKSQWRRELGWTLLIAAMCVPLLAYFSYKLSSNPSNAMTKAVVSASLMTIAYGAYVGFTLNPRAHRRRLERRFIKNLRSTGLLKHNGHHEVELHNLGMTMNTASTSTQWIWESMTEVEQTSDALFVVFGDGTCVRIPNRAFKDTNEHRHFMETIIGRLPRLIDAKSIAGASFGSTTGPRSR